MSDLLGLATPAGHCCSHASAARRLGVTPEALEGLAARSRVLRVWSLADGSPAYPVWQFGDDGRVWPSVASLLPNFEGLAAWSTAVWWMTPHDLLEGLAPAEWVETGRPGDRLVPLVFREVVDRHAELGNHVGEERRPATVWLLRDGHDVRGVYADADAGWTDYYRLRMVAGVDQDGSVAGSPVSLTATPVLARPLLGHDPVG